MYLNSQMTKEVIIPFTTIFSRSSTLQRISTMISKVVLLLLPAVVLSEISVTIQGSKDPLVDCTDSFSDVISDPERSTFRINDNELKDAVNKYTQRRPDDAYVRSPTPWGDLYQKMGWSEVRRTVKVRSSRVVGVNTQPIIIAKKKFHNGSPRPATYSGSISQSEESTVSHKWSKSGSITVGQKINYNMNLGGGSVGGTTSFSFQNSFGEENVNTAVTKLGSSAAITITLQPGQSAEAVLTASKGTIDVEVEYEASLEGSVATNYGKKHNGHHFWAFDINGVLDAGGLPRTVVWRENMHINFFSDERVTAYDANGNPMS